MDERLQAMLDHFEITKVLAQYCNACDRCDAERMADIYCEDSWDDHGRYKGPGKKFAEVTTISILQNTETLYHMLGQAIIDVDGDEAGAETYFFAASETTEADGTAMVNQLGGRFVDKLRRENGKWRVAHRVAVRDWTVAIPRTHDWATARMLTPGERSNADPCFAVLRAQHSGFASDKVAAE